jgi:hypothetical protein
MPEQYGAGGGGSSGPTTLTWTAVTFENSWQNYSVGSGDTTFNNAAYAIDGAGVVHLRGLIQGGDAATAAFNLPSAYRPVKNNLYPAAYDTGSGFVFTQVRVESTGDVVPEATIGAGSEYLSIDGLTFSALD